MARARALRWWLRLEKGSQGGVKMARSEGGAEAAARAASGNVVSRVRPRGAQAVARTSCRWGSCSAAET